MDILKVEEQITTKISQNIKLQQEGNNRFRVFNPFMWDDGDHLCIVLKKIDNQWFFTDEGHTFMHLTYSIPEKSLFKGNRYKIISSNLASFGVEDIKGRLIIKIENENYGDALFSFIQSLMKITDINYLTKEMVRSTFLDDFKSLIEETVPQDRRIFDYCDPDRDIERLYPIDCMINNMSRPLHIYAISNDDKCRDVRIFINQHHEWGIKSFKVGIFQNQEEINRKVLARLTNVCDKQFSSLIGNELLIQGYIKEYVGI